MESTLSAATTRTTELLAALPKTLNQTSSPATSRLRSQIVSLQFRSSKALKSVKSSSNPLTSLCAMGVPPAGSRLECVASSAASFASTAGRGGGGGDGGDGGSRGGGAGDGAADGGEAKSNSVVGSSEEVAVLSSDVIILDVRGMTCGGCAAKVKSILESQPQVSSASVNLATETATVWPVSEAKVCPNWQKDVGETLAKHLTSCGFSSNLLRA